MSTWNISDEPSQAGKVAIVTGANSGIGYEVTVGLLKKGFEVIMACRNIEKAQKAKATIIEQLPNAKITVIQIDTSSLQSVNKFAEKCKQQYKQLHLLINNAGIMMSPFKMTDDGFENQFATNYIGHFALTGLLLPLLTNTTGSRVVSLSSLAYKWATIDFDDLHASKKYSKTKAYGQSKRACLMFAFELQRRLTAEGFNTLSLAAHPGLSKTNLDQYYPAWLRPLGNLFLQPARKGALPVLYAALCKHVKGGEFIGPDGFQQMRGNATEVFADAYSHNIEVAKRLWLESEKMTDIFYLNASI